MERRLATFLAADMMGYSRLMAADETGTLARQKTHRRELIDPKIAEHGGWAERYDGSLDDVLALQDKVTIKIIGALSVQLTADEIHRRHRCSEDVA